MGSQIWVCSPDSQSSAIKAEHTPAHSPVMMCLYTNTDTSARPWHPVPHPVFVKHIQGWGLHTSLGRTLQYSITLSVKNFPEVPRDDTGQFPPLHTPALGFLLLLPQSQAGLDPWEALRFLYPEHSVSPPHLHPALLTHPTAG